MPSSHDDNDDKPPMQFINLRDEGLYVFKENIKELEQKLAEAEAEWRACDGSASIDGLRAAFYNRIALKKQLDKMNMDMKNIFN